MTGVARRILLGGRPRKTPVIAFIISFSMRFPLFYPAGAAVFFLLLATPGQSQVAATPMMLPRPDGVSDLTFRQAGAACSQPFGLHQGQNLEYQLLDAKGRLTGFLRYRVLNISTDSSVEKKKRTVITTKVRLKSGLYGPKSQLLQQQDLTFLCRNDTILTDGLGEINYDGLKSFRDRLLAYEGTPLAWPNQPSAGSHLPDGGVVVQVSSPSVAIAKVKTTLRQRTVLAGPAPITVPAGTFTCYAVESQRELATAARVDLVLKSGGREVDYYAPSVGIVKTEYYDKGGKLLQTRVLAKR